MSIFRCKMCGGDLEIIENASSCICDFCGTQQTIPTIKDENLQGLFNRANVLRMKSEFDKAEEIYEKILQSSSTEAEAYWGLILCKYGIEYVEDPATFKRAPICHRASYESITADEDYKSALRYADVQQKLIYEAEAKTIEEVQKGIMALVAKEEPYDVFICYKETDESGKRTQDSVIANDIYYQLTQEGFKVFYAAITLEDKLGTEYEPYIFSALNTARVMLSLGTKPEYFNAVWVKNEWSRFLKIMMKDRSKMLIPCYRDMDPYELPEEFAHLQAQDMSKIGFINDIVRGIKKVVAKEDSNSVAETVVVQQAPAVSSNVQALLDRGSMALEDGDWDKADVLYGEVLNRDAKCAEAYLGKLLAWWHKSDFEDYIESQCSKCRKLDDILSDTIFKRIKQYMSGKFADMINDGLSQIEAAIENRKEEVRYADNDWIVLDVKEGRALLLSKNVIECRQYNDDFKDITWEDCTLREWLNNEYLNVVFSEDERQVILETDVVNSGNPMSGTAGGNNTKDKIFLLSIDEVNKYFASDEERIVRTDKGEQVCWWLRSPGVERYLAAKVLFDGHVDKHGDAVDDGTDLDVGHGVRPAFWIDASYLAAQEHFDWIIKRQYQEDIFRKLFKRIKQFMLGELSYADNDWIVLDVKEGRALLLSKNAISFRPYNDDFEDITWEDCTLREWLNNEYLNEAFSEDERQAILETDVVNSDNPSYGTAGGNNTKDKIFLLSIDEVNKYFASDEERIVREPVDDYPIDWWLRSPGSERYVAANVYFDGSVCVSGSDVDGGIDFNRVYGVRPAFWIDVSYLAALKHSDWITKRQYQKNILRRLFRRTKQFMSGEFADMINAGINKIIKAARQEADRERCDAIMAITNGASSISYGDNEWIVIDVKEGRALLLSKNVIENRSYHDDFEDITWEECTLRKWLNEEYINRAFDENERAAIVETDVVNSSNPEYGTAGGNDTKDKIFLLSIGEVNKYFSSDEEREVLTAEGESAWWWLRSPGLTSNNAAYALHDGSVDEFGHYVISGYGVRPAFWIDASNL